MINASKSSRSLLLAAFAALAVPAFAATALADVQPTVSEGEAGAPHRAHPGTRVSVTGEVARYVVGPLGHVRGFLLRDGTAVLVHGTSGDVMARDLPVGQSVRVEGWSPAPSGGKAIMHAAVFGPHGQVVAAPARGPGEGRGGGGPEKHGELRGEIARLPDASANGTVAAVIPGRQGKPVAVVLTDGTSVFLRPRLANAVMARGIRVGDRIESQGKGATYPLGASVLVRSISFADGTHFEAPAHAPTASR